VDVFLLFFSASAILADRIVTMLLTRGISRERRKAFSPLKPGGGGKKCQTHEIDNLSLEEALSERFYRKKNMCLGFWIRRHVRKSKSHVPRKCATESGDPSQESLGHQNEGLEGGAQK